MKWYKNRKSHLLRCPGLRKKCLTWYMSELLSVNQVNIRGKILMRQRKQQMLRAKVGSLF